MAFSRTTYDQQAYAHSLSEAAAATCYVLDDQIAPPDVAGLGPPACNPLLVDAGSDLRGLGRPTSRAAPSMGTYLPGPPCQAVDPGAYRSAADPVRSVTHARVSDPPATLRGTGWNRFEWLCHDPQARIDLLMQQQMRPAHSRILAKDYLPV